MLGSRVRGSIPGAVFFELAWVLVEFAIAAKLRTVGDTRFTQA